MVLSAPHSAAESTLKTSRAFMHLALRALICIKSQQNSEMCDAGKPKYYLNISFVGLCQKLNVVIICIIKVARIGTMVYWGLTSQQQPGSYQGGEMMMMKSVIWWRKPEYPEETTDLRQVTDETFHTYGLCPVRGLNLGRSGVKQSELRRDESGALAHRATAVPSRIGKNSIISTQQMAQFFEIVTKEGIIILYFKIVSHSSRIYSLHCVNLSNSDQLKCLVFLGGSPPPPGIFLEIIRVETSHIGPLILSHAFKNFPLNSPIFVKQKIPFKFPSFFLPGCMMAAILLFLIYFSVSTGGPPSEIIRTGSC